MAALGVRDHRFLDEVGYGFAPVHYRDSGMAYGPGREVIPLRDPRPDAFALAGVEDAASRLAAVVREVRPQVVIMYEPGGGYGHPDHVQAHRVGMRGIDLAAEPGPGGPRWEVPKVYWSVIPHRLMGELVEAMRERGDNPFEEWQAGPVPSMFVADELVTAGIDGRAYLTAKEAAMRAHATQISVEGPFFALTNNVGRPMIGMEFYRLVRGEPGGPRDADGRETDLFGGLPDT
jgi:N-acetyl-1-D-myo-inositol-2-amino-2-deoxy-alpha-D-glucopyranoside deacetylase